MWTKCPSMLFNVKECKTRFRGCSTREVKFVLLLLIHGRIKLNPRSVQLLCNPKIFERLPQWTRSDNDTQQLQSYCSVEIYNVFNWKRLWPVTNAKKNDVLDLKRRNIALINIINILNSFEVVSKTVNPGSTSKSYSSRI